MTGKVQRDFGGGTTILRHIGLGQIDFDKVAIVFGRNRGFGFVVSPRGFETAPLTEAKRAALEFDNDLTKRQANAVPQTHSLNRADGPLAAQHAQHILTYVQGGTLQGRFGNTSNVRGEDEVFEAAQRIGLGRRLLLAHVEGCSG